MSEKKPRSGSTLRLFRYCRSCADRYGLPAGDGNRLPTPGRCELCGQIAIRYFTDKTLTAAVLGVDIDAIIAERALNN
jgi:hypothetical protein